MKEKWYPICTKCSKTKTLEDRHHSYCRKCYSTYKRASYGRHREKNIERVKNLMSEIDIQNAIRVALSSQGCIIFRNNVGFAKFPDGSAVKYGLCNGSSDLIGIAPGGKFLAIEVKMPSKKVSKEQNNFIKIVKLNGGIAGVATSVEEALALIVV